MKHVTYNFSNSDIDACLFSLSHLDVLHDDEISDAQVSINEHCAISAGKKLIAHEHLSANELRVLCCCITCCHLICTGEMSVDSDIKKECMQYVFTLNKLDSELCSQIM